MASKNCVPKVVLSTVILSLIGVAVWRYHAVAESGSLGPPTRYKASQRPDEPANRPPLIDSDEVQIERGQQRGQQREAASLLPVELKETAAGQVRIQRSFGPDGGLLKEEELLNGDLISTRYANREGLIPLEVRESPQGQIQIQRTFDPSGAVVKEEAYLNGVLIELPESPVDSE